MPATTPCVVTPRRLTKYELTGLIGMRVEQLNRGALPTVDVGDLTNVRDIAYKELREKKMPLMVSRPLPGGQIEILRVDDIEFDD
jgi:DNA-directed RNA polymerase I, II, and III subunit RPABC2